MELSSPPSSWNSDNRATLRRLNFDTQIHRTNLRNFGERQSIHLRTENHDQKLDTQRESTIPSAETKPELVFILFYSPIIYNLSFFSWKYCTRTVFKPVQQTWMLSVNIFSLSHLH